MQQVNLYRRGNAASATGTRVLAPVAVLAMLGLVALTLCGLTVFGHVRLERLERQLAALREQQSTEAARFEQVAALMAGKTPEQIDKHVESLTRTLGARGAALRALKAGAAGTTVGFSARFEALARGHVAGLWLVRVAIDSRASAVALTGRAADPGLIPRYLESLSHQKAFTGSRFSHLHIERDSEGGTVRFEVATVAPHASHEGGS